MANKLIDKLYNYLPGFLKAKPKSIQQAPPAKAEPIDDRKTKGVLPNGRQSKPSLDNGLLSGFPGEYRQVSPNFLVELIPIIRALAMYNPDVSQALHNVTTLGNTGHRINFDKNVSPEQVDKMRNHLLNKRKSWAPGTPGRDGLVNKLLAQVIIGGAASAEWVPNSTLTGIQTCLLVNPEEIVFTIDKKNTSYTPNQRPRSGAFFGSKDPVNGDLVKLNENTYRYFALNGDTELPYGIPPYLPVIRKVKTQSAMDDNIDFIVDQLGLIGFLEVLVQKPDQEDGKEDDQQYDQRLDNLLTQAKARIMSGGLKEGVVVGFKDEHEFNFNSAAKNFEGVTSLYQENELQVASGVKHDAALLGRGYATSETQITVVFMKMLSELKNWQNPVKEMLEFGYSLELRLAGFNFESLNVVFNRSTIQDDLKYQQSEEIKIRNVIAKFCLGIISLQTAAEELGYENPDQLTPRVMIELLMGKSGPGASGDGKSPEQKKKRQKQKQDSKKKTKSKRSAL